MNIKQISLLSALITGLIIGNAYANQYNIALLSSCFSNMVKNMIPGKSKATQTVEIVNEQNISIQTSENTIEQNSPVILNISPGKPTWHSPEIAAQKWRNNKIWHNNEYLTIQEHLGKSFNLKHRIVRNGFFEPYFTDEEWDKKWSTFEFTTTYKGGVYCPEDNILIGGNQNPNICNLYKEFKEEKKLRKSKIKQS